MTREEFDTLVRKLEAISQKYPKYYLARIIGLIALAYTYLFIVLIGSLLLALAMIVMVIKVPASAKLAFIGMMAFGGIFWAVLRGLWVKLEPPTGLEATREQSPELFRLLDELRAELKCRPFHKVIFIAEMNAAVVQIPRLGIFGWHINFLLIGLPLMQGLSPLEFKAVLAHEFAHSSGGHGRFGNWLYRTRRTWERVVEQMARQRTRFGGVLFKFINWFWPVFNGHAFVLARANEYEADACSVRLAGTDAAASALMRLPVTDTLLNEKFWPQIFSAANQHKEPPANVMLDMQMALRQGLEQTEAQKRLRQGFLMETNNSDTHPCLKDRLRAMGRFPSGIEGKDFTVEPPPLPSRAAAEYYLGKHAEVIMQALSDEWRNAVSQNWAARYEQSQKLATELAALEKAGVEPANVEKLWEKAIKLIQLHSDKEALPVIRQILELDPKHAAANFVAGRHALENDDAGGVALVEAALDAEPELTEQGCNILYAYFHRNGLREQIKTLQHRMDEFQETTIAAQKERNQVTAANTFLPPDLTPDQLASLGGIFAARKEISTVVVARKQVEHFKKNPCFVIGLTLKVPWWKPRSSSANGKLVDHILKQISLPGHFLVFVNEKNLVSLGKKIADVAGSKIYERPKK